MPQVTFRQSVAAGATFNALRDSLFETLPYPALVEIGLMATLVSMVATINSGPDTLAEEGPVPFTATERLPIYPDDYIWTDEAAAGDKLKILIRNNNAGANVVNGVVKITPLV